jgi:gamma-glutamylaminecyclotransferase
MGHKVFVYGSLLSGLHNHRHLAGAARTGAGRTLATSFRMFDLGGFPGVVADLQPAPPDGAIKGELYEVGDDTLADLDRLEGNGRFYTRRVAVVQTDDGRLHRAWLYFLPPRAVVGRPAVKGGDWRRHWREKQRYAAAPA